MPDPPRPTPRRPGFDLELPRPVVVYMSRNSSGRGVLNEEELLRYIVSRYNVTLRVTTFAEPMDVAMDMLSVSGVVGTVDACLRSCSSSTSTLPHWARGGALHVRRVALSCASLLSCCLLPLVLVNRVFASWVFAFLQKTDVLLGMHGAGWTNALFVKQGATGLQVLPSHACVCACARCALPCGPKSAWRIPHDSRSHACVLWCRFCRTGSCAHQAALSVAAIMKTFS